MNYIQEINAFYNWIETNPCTHAEINLWHALMHIANKTYWKPTFSVSMKVLESKTGLEKRTIERARLKLVHKGVLKYTPFKGKKAPQYSLLSVAQRVAFENPDTVSTTSIDPTLTGALPVALGDALPDALPDAINKQNKNKKENKDNIPYTEIINYLNMKTNKDFKATTKTTQAHIRARFNESFTLEDFKKVIDVKTSEWLNNKEMAKYLRPETLFGTKFEAYLNESITKEDNDLDDLFHGRTVL